VRALAPDGVDAVFDTVGHGLIAASIGLGRTAARFASVVDFDPPATRPVFARLESADLHEVARLAEAGQLRPKVGVVVPLAEAPEARRLAATRHGRGRIVLRISGGPTEY
jgi:NADPH:quinone reductase-like Zn-dependent oxidoreductase